MQRIISEIYSAISVDISPGTGPLGAYCSPNHNSNPGEASTRLAVTPIARYPWQNIYFHIHQAFCRTHTNQIFTPTKNVDRKDDNKFTETAVRRESRLQLHSWTQPGLGLMWLTQRKDFKVFPQKNIPLNVDNKKSVLQKKKKKKVWLSNEPGILYSRRTGASFVKQRSIRKKSFIFLCYFLNVHWSWRSAYSEWFSKFSLPLGGKCVNPLLFDWLMVCEGIFS